MHGCQVFSVLSMFSIGVGPSSSHTVGPMRAAYAFVDSLSSRSLLDRVRRVRVDLYGSLALTGRGHGTDRAAVVGLEGNLPEHVDTGHLLTIRRECEDSRSLSLFGRQTIPFDYSRDIVFSRWQRMAAHPNGMRFTADDADGNVIDEQVWYSIGGGFIRRGSVDDPVIGLHERVASSVVVPPASGPSEGDASGRAASGVASSASKASGEMCEKPGSAVSPKEAAPTEVPLDFSSCDELMRLCEQENCRVDQIVARNEAVLHPNGESHERLLDVWDVMRRCVLNGCTSTQRVLPGGLRVPRRAPEIYRRLAGHGDVLHGGKVSIGSGETGADYASWQSDWVNLFALAVSEENAGGGRIVTAPTNGAAGIIPAVLHYYRYLTDGADDEGVLRFLLTAGAVGYLFKRNASISGAEVGCQGEVGSACSMAAAGLCSVMGGTPRQVENAAEIGIEHNLGLTCDPVGGLVQIPCIERNAMAANTAINAARIAMLGNGMHRVSLDQAIKTMKETGEDMMDKYKETAKGGLAVNVVEC
jgi:L-serine dehydratase